MNSDEALQSYLDHKIPRAAQSDHARDVSMIKGGWVAAILWSGQQAIRREKEAKEKRELLIEDGGLLACAFCGSPGGYGEVTKEGDSFGGQFIECTNPQCGASTLLMFPTMGSVKELLAERWNRRYRFA